MKKLICEVDEDYFNELCEVFKKKPMGGIPTHRAWALLEGLKNGIVLDGLTNGEVLMKIYNVDADDVKIGLYYVNVFLDEKIVTFNLEWWNAKWGE